jgi:hypothetical protein
VLHCLSTSVTLWHALRLPPLYVPLPRSPLAMDSAAAAPPLPRHVVRLSAALSALLGGAEGGEINEVAGRPEDELLDELRAAGLVTPAVHAANSAPQSLAGAATTATAAAAATAASSSIDRRVVRLADALAALLGHAEGAEITEDEVLGSLREAGLITYPSPLLGRLLGELRDLFAAEVLPQLDPTARALFSRVGGACRAAVVASGLPRAGTISGEPFEVRHFVATVPLLAWANSKGCPWNAKTCEHAAVHGHLDSLKWARENLCPWEGAYTRSHFSSV